MDYNCDAHLEAYIVFGDVRLRSILILKSIACVHGLIINMGC